MNCCRLGVGLFLAVVVTGCGQSPASPEGFSLPEGNPELGKAVFEDLKCYGCHTVSGLEFPQTDEPSPISVALGGEVNRVKSYGELVTSVINPSHRLAKGYDREIVGLEGTSRMPSYNEVMTVGDLIHLVAFLQSSYDVKPYDYTDYPTYEYPAHMYEGLDSEVTD